MNNRIMNLTYNEDLNFTDIPKEICVLNAVKRPIQSILANLDSNQRLHTLHSCINMTIEGANLYSNINSNQKINVKDVALIVDVNECEARSILALNTCYQTFDINNMQSLTFFSDMCEYGEKLKGDDYNFFQLALKCACTVNTRISPLSSTPASMTDFEYSKQNFLDLIKLIVENQSFTLAINGYPHDIDCTTKGKVRVDREPIISISNLNRGMTSVVINMYKKQPTQLN